MSLLDRIVEETRELPENAQQQVLDFTLFLKSRQQKELAQDIQQIIDENLTAFKELAQ